MVDNIGQQSLFQGHTGILHASLSDTQRSVLISLSFNWAPKCPTSDTLELFSITIRTFASCQCWCPLHQEVPVDFAIIKRMFFAYSLPFLKTFSHFSLHKDPIFFETIRQRRCSLLSIATVNVEYLTMFSIRPSDFLQRKHAKYLSPKSREKIQFFVIGRFSGT